MTVSVDAFIPTIPGRYAWAFPAANFSHVLSIYWGHFMDLLFQAAGFPDRRQAVVENHFPFFIVAETGERIPTTNPNEVMVIGSLEGAACFPFRSKAQKHRTGLQIDITGTEGVLQITNKLAFQHKEDNSIEGVNGDGVSLSPISVPDQYQSLAAPHLDASTQDMLYLYAAYASDRKNGTSEASNFMDAVRQHHLINQIVQTSEAFFNQRRGQSTR